MIEAIEAVMIIRDLITDSLRRNQPRRNRCDRGTSPCLGLPRLGDSVLSALDASVTRLTRWFQAAPRQAVGISGNFLAFILDNSSLPPATSGQLVLGDAHC